MGLVGSKSNTKLIQKLKDSADQHDEWTKQIELGDGSFGKVYTATNNKTNQIAALKEIYIEEDIEECLNEIIILSQVDHANIIGFISAYLLESTNTIYMYSEFCLFGSLDNLMEKMRKQKQTLSEPQINFILKSVVTAVSYLHEQRIIHRDIKAGNILLNEIGIVKLADFGIAVQMRGDKGRSTFIGSPYWMAPEIFACQSEADASYTTSVDIWSIGVTAIELAQGKPPHDEIIPFRVGFIIVKSDPPQLNNPKPWSVKFTKFISSTVIKNPSNRPTAIQLLNSEFLSQDAGDSCLKSILQETFKIKDAGFKIETAVSKTETAGSKISSITEKSDISFDDEVILPPNEFADEFSTTSSFVEGESLEIPFKENGIKNFSVDNLSKSNLRQFRKWQNKCRATENKIRREVTKSHEEMTAKNSETIQKLFLKLNSSLQKMGKSRAHELKTAISLSIKDHKTFCKTLLHHETHDIDLYRKSLKRELKIQSKNANKWERSCLEKTLILKEVDFVAEIKEKNQQKEKEHSQRQLGGLLEIESKYWDQKKLLLSSVSESMCEIKVKYQREMEKLLKEGLEMIYEAKVEEQEERFGLIYDFLVTEERQSVGRIEEKYSGLKKMERKIKKRTKNNNYVDALSDLTGLKKRREQESEWILSYYGNQYKQLEEDKNMCILEIEESKRRDQVKIEEGVALRLSEIERMNVEELVEGERGELEEIYLEEEILEDLAKKVVEFDITKVVGISFCVDW